MSGPRTCELCDDEPRDEEYPARYFAPVGRRVCDLCADRVANGYWYLHSGQWLTWPNEPRPKQRPPISEELRWEVFRRDGFRCKHCGAQSHLRADHVIPYSADGPTTLDNLQTLCHSCNSKKGTKL